MSFMRRKSDMGVVPATSVSAQERLMTSRGVSGWIRLKEPRYRRISNKWPRRFVILGDDTLYIYDDEQSSSTKQAVMMLGYKGVYRYHCNTHEWCFSLVPGMDALKAITFACVSDRDRLTWMIAVKKLLYTANRVMEPDESVTIRAKLQACVQGNEYATIDDDFCILEKNVFEPFMPSEIDTHRMSSISSSSGSTNDDSASGSFGSVSSETRSTITKDMKQRQRDIDLDRPPLTRAPAVPKPVPKYVNSKAENVVEDDESSDDGYDYPPTLIEQCSMTDSGLSREELILQLKNLPSGTYLLRNSRADNRKVLAVQTGCTGIKELKIYEENGKFTIDRKDSFKTIEEVLQYYSTRKPVPNSMVFLAKGIKYAKPVDEDEFATYNEVD